jgi:hypothetical protein
MEFRAATYQNEFLAEGATAVDAIVTVGASVGAGPTRPAHSERAVVIVLDMSGSMRPREKLMAARGAARAAIAALGDGVRFGVVAGSHEASFLYPQTGLAVSDARTRADAWMAVRRATADGGTAMSTWLRAARHRLAPLPGAIRNVILLTDGRNESETRADLEAAVDDCDGIFQCDCRGVGTGWDVEELRFIASRLLGSVDIIPRAEDMAGDLAAITAHAITKRTADVTLRLWTPRGAEIGYIKQVAPTIEDLTGRAVRVDERTVDVPTGSWGSEERDYHLHLVLPAHEVGAEMLAGRVSLVVDGEVVTRSLVRAVWTDDRAVSTRLHPRVAHYTGQVELASAIAAGLAARAEGDAHTATIHLGRAAQLAATSGHDDTLTLLTGVVDIVDAGTGTVRLRRHVDAADAMTLDTRSTRTVRSER